MQTALIHDAAKQKSGGKVFRRFSFDLKSDRRYARQSRRHAKFALS